MFAVPAAAEMTVAVVDVVAPIYATEVSPLDHVPPPVEVLSVVAPPAHIISVPDIEAVGAFTVTVAVRRQPVGAVYETIAVPAVTPVTTPDAESTVTLVEEVLQVPPDVALPSVVVPPIHTDRVPVMVAGSELTVT